MLYHPCRIKSALVTMAALALSSPLTSEAQEWSADQLEVWAVVSQLCEAFYENDVEGVYELTSPEFVIWNTGNDVPGDYETAFALDSVEWPQGRQWLTGNCSPLTIQVFDTFAVVNAYGRALLEPIASGQGPEWQTMRLHMTWRRDGNGWLQVANYLDFTQRIGVR